MNNVYKKNKLWLKYLALLCCALMFSFVTYGQAVSNNSQWGKNGKASAPVSPVNWANGNAQGNNSHFIEGQSVPNRLEVTGLTGSVTATVTFNINIVQGSYTPAKHAFDFFTGPNRISEAVQPLDGLTGYTSPPTYTQFPIPSPANTTGGTYALTALKMACQQASDAADLTKNSLWAYNAKVIDIRYVWGNENGTSTEFAYCTVTFVPIGNKALFAFGCHIAAENDYIACANNSGWGIGNGATAISGSPYHLHISEVCQPVGTCVSIGNMDQQMQTDAVCTQPIVSVNSAAVCAGNGATLSATVTNLDVKNLSFLWTPGNYTTQTINVTPGSTTTYTVTVTNKNGGCTGSTSGVVYVNSLPVAQTLTPGCDPLLANRGKTMITMSNSETGVNYQLLSGGTNVGSPKPGSTGSPVVWNNLPVGTYTIHASNSTTTCSTDFGPVTTVPCPSCDLRIESSSQTNVSCNGGSNGSIVLTVTGTSSYTYTWDGPGTHDGSGQFHGNATVTISNLVAGSYTVTVTDDVDPTNCKTGTKMTLTEPDALDLGLTPTNATCYGGAKSISADITGTPLTDLEIDIDGEGYAAVTSSPVVFNGLAAGNHTVTLRRISDNSCMVSKDQEVTEPDALDLGLTPTNATCYGGAKSISADITGTPLTDLEIDIDGEGYAAVTSSPVVFNGLAAGNHTVTLRRISDNSCMVSKDQEVTEPDALDLGLTPTNATCYGGAKSISADITGTPLTDLEIDIDGEGYAAVTSSPVVFNGLAAGNHTVTLRRISDNSCMVSKDQEVTEPDALDLGLTPTNATCYGGAKSISADITGTPLTDLEIDIDGEGYAAVTSSPVVFNGLAAGNHTVTLRRISDNSCMVSKDQEVTEPDALDLGLTPTNATCYGGAKSISADITGTPLTDLEIDIDGEGYAAVTSSPVVFNGLAAGNHTVTLRRISDNSCMVSKDQEVTEPDALDLGLTPTNATCYGGAKSISADITGTPLTDLEIDIDGEGYAAVTSSPVVFNGLAAGNHTVTLRRISDNSCMVSKDQEVTEPDALDLGLTPTNATCYGGAKSISADITGTPLTDLEIDIDGEGYAAVTSSPVVFNGLAAGNHTVTLRRISDNSCMVSKDQEVTEPDALDLGLTPTNATCYGGAKSISADITGTPLTDLEIDIDGEGYAAVTSSPVVFNGLAAGNHTVTLRRISDNSCMVSKDQEVTEPDALDLGLTPTNATCYGGAKSISADITGTPLTDLEIDIDGEGYAAVTSSPVVFNGLAAGNHTVTLRRISDNSCMVSKDQEVTEPDALDLGLTPTNATCYGGAKSISADITGTPLTDLEIDIDGEGYAAVTSSPVVFNGLAAGNHTVTLRRISDNSCMVSKDQEVTEPDALDLGLTPTNATCYGGAKSISADITGTPLTDLEIDIDGEGYAAVTSSPVVFNGLAAGNHTVTLRRISDNSCMVSKDQEVTEPDALDLGLTPTNATCYGGAKSISADITGTPLTDLEIDIDGEGYAAVTSSPVVFNGLAAGNHTVTLRRISDNSCMVSKDQEVTEPDALDLGLTPTNATCYGGAKSISADITGTPLTDLEIDIDGEGYAAVTSSPVVFNGLAAGNHTVTLRRISDNSCMVSKDQEVTEPDALDLGLTPTNATCYGGAKSISADITGTPLTDLEIDIDGEGYAAVTSSPVVFNGLAAGNHTVTLRRISDNSCMVSKDQEVTEPDALDLGLTPTNATCYGGAKSISADITGTPLTDLEIDIDGEGYAAVTSSPVVFNGLAAGNHTVTLRRISDNSCMVSKDQEVTEPDALDLGLTPTNATCYGGAKSISADITGTPLTDLEIDIDGEGYAAVTSSPVVFNGLAAGNHTVTLRRISDNSCMVSKDQEVTEPDALDLGLTPTNATCYGGAKSISADITGTPLTDLEIDIDGEGYAAVTSSPVVFNGLAAGNHTVTLRRISDNSCMVSKDQEVTEPDALDLGLTPTNATCYGGAKSISADITGTPLTDLEIDIDGEGYAAVTSSPVVFNGLAAGNHTVTLRRISDNSCMVSKDQEVTEPDALDLGLTPTNATCYGGAKSISADITGTPLTDLEIDIDGEGYAAVTSSPVVFNGLAAGNHTVTLRRISDNSCMVSKDQEVTEPDALDLGLTPTNATCYGGAKSISADITGTPLTDLEIDIDGEGYAAVTSSPVVFNGLAAGNHTVTLRRISDNSCMVSKDQEVTEPDALDLGLTPTNATCNAIDGIISAAIMGSPLSALEIDIDGKGYATVTANPTVFGGLTAGTHTVTVRRIADIDCMVSKDVLVSQDPCAWQCETAFGKASSGSFCFLNDPAVPNNRWGWTNSINPGTTTFTLYAGASGCNVSNDKIAGTVTVVYAWPNVTVTYNTNNGYVMSEAHLYVGSSKYPMKGNKVTVAPGQYPYSAGSLNNVTTYTFNITLKGNQPSTMYVIAHAVTCKQAASTTTLVAQKGAQITTGLEARSLKAYPNPFSDKVTLEFVSDKDAHAVLEITNMLGQKIATLLDGSVKEGVMNRVEFTPRNVAPGILIYRLIMDGNVQNGRIIYKK